MTRDEQKIINAFRYWIDTNTEKGVTTIPEYLCEKVYSMKTQALSQELNRDIKEIAEVIKSDVDAETKCKMISNILTAKPHYFEVSQEPTDKSNLEKICEELTLENDDLRDQLAMRDRFKQEPCDDVVRIQTMQIELKNCEVVDMYDENDNFVGFMCELRCKND